MHHLPVALKNNFARLNEKSTSEKALCLFGLSFSRVFGGGWLEKRFVRQRPLPLKADNPLARQKTGSRFPFLH